MDDILDDLKRYKADAMRSQDAGRQIVYTRAIDEIERLRALLVEVRGDINDYGFSDSFADETHKTLAKIDIGLSQAYQ